MLRVVQNILNCRVGGHESTYDPLVVFIDVLCVVKVSIKDCNAHKGPFFMVHLFELLLISCRVYLLTWFYDC
jgi:hypothetical protein